MGYIHIGPLSLPVPFGKGNKVQQRRLNDFLDPETGIKVHLKPSVLPLIEQDTSLDTISFLSSEEVTTERNRKPSEKVVQVLQANFLPTKVYKKLKLKKKLPPPQPSLKEKIGKKLDTPWIDKLAVFCVAGMQIMLPFGIITFFGFLLFAMICPSCIVGYAPPGTITPDNSTNITNTTIPVTPVPVPVVPVPSNTIVVILPDTGTPSTPQVPSHPVVTPPPPQVNTTPVVTPPVRSIQEIPQNLQYQAKYDCYWSLRDKGLGKYLAVEAICQSADTGLWIEACECLTYMQQHP